MKAVWAMEETARRLGELLCRRREELGLTQRQLAEQAGVSVRTVRNLERGQVGRPRAGSVRRVAATLGVPGTDLPQPSTGAELCIDILGTLSVRRGDRPIRIPSARLRGLLGLLAIQPAQPVSREHIVDVLWDDRPPRTCRALVTTYAARLRGLLEPDRHARGPARIITRAHGGYQLDLTHLRLDLAHFDELAGQARAAQVAGRLDAAYDLFGQALASWRGPILADAGPGLAQHRAAVAASQRRLDAALSFADLGLGLSRAEHSVAWLRTLAADEPMHEGLHARLMLALAAAGQQAAALDLYATLRARLNVELGIEPGSEIQAAHLRVLRQDLGAAPAPAAPVLEIPQAQLPADTAGFVGRAGPQRRLAAVLKQAQNDRDAAVALIAICGTAGVGKTALAVHWAHRVASRFDGQLYVNLMGFGPGAAPADPAEAVRGFLVALGVPPARLPVGLPDQAALYRSLISGRRMLILLDNARDAEQVRPLLPGSPGCMVLVTSRDQLSSLTAIDGAKPLPLELLSAAEARQLLARRLGQARVAAERPAADEIIRRTARLPLALAIVSARAAAHPGFPLAALAGELRDTDGGLAALAGPDASADVRAVLSWSYRSLSTPARRLFRLLGLHPGPDLGRDATASLAAVSPERAARLLAELAGAHLVTEHRPGRFAFHDLLRAYAAELVRVHDPAPARKAAAARFVDHYLHTAYGAARLLHPHRDPIALTPPGSGVTPHNLASHEQAMAWFTGEHSVLLSIVGTAVAAGMDRQAWQLVWTLATYFDRRGHWHHQAATQRVALEAAQRLADLSGQAHARRYLALAQVQLGDLETAHAQLRDALGLYDRAADLPGQAYTQLNLALVVERKGNGREALQHTRRALELFREAGHRYGQALALNNLGWDLSQLGRHRQALRLCREALGLQQEIGNQPGTAATWHSIGYIHHRLGHYPQAIDCYEHAFGVYRELADRYHQGAVLADRGETHRADGRPDLAATAWQHALWIFEQLRHPDAEQVRASLAKLELT